MLASETTTLAEAEADIDGDLEMLRDERDALADGTDDAAAVDQRINRLEYLREGLRWHIDDWGADTEIVVGALTAGEEAMMDRERPDDASAKERRLWYVAAATDAAPYVGDTLAETFRNVADLHPAFVAWIEARSNKLGVAGNRSSTSSRGSGSSGTSTHTSDETT